MVDGVSIDFMPHASQDHMIIQDQRLQFLARLNSPLEIGGRRSNTTQTPCSIQFHACSWHAREKYRDSQRGIMENRWWAAGNQRGE